MEMEYKEISGEILGGKGNTRKYQVEKGIQGNNRWKKEYKEISGKMEISGLE